MGGRKRGSSRGAPFWGGSTPKFQETRVRLSVRKKPIKSLSQGTAGVKAITVTFSSPSQSSLWAVESLASQPQWHVETSTSVRKPCFREDCVDKAGLRLACIRLKQPPSQERARQGARHPIKGTMALSIILATVVVLLLGSCWLWSGAESALHVVLQMWQGGWQQSWSRKIKGC